MVGDDRIKLLARGLVRFALCCAAASAGLADTITYADHTFGFELELPADWEYDRARYPGAAGSIGLLRGWYGEGQRSLKIEIFRSYRATKFPDWVESFTKKIAEVRGTERIATKTRNEVRGDCIIEATGATIVAESKRYYVCVPYDEQTVWVMSVAVLGNDPENLRQAAEVVETAYKSLKVHYSPAGKKELSVALRRGQAVMARLMAGATPVAITSEPRYYELVGEDGPNGYTSHRIASEVHDKKRGWRTRTQTWEFGRDGAARYIRTNAFCALDFSSEQIETRADHISGGGEQRSVLTTLDQCIRERDSLFTTYSRSDEPRNFEAPPSVRTGPSYLPHVLLRQLPAILGREPGEWHAFVIYDTQVRALLFHSIRGMGTQQPPGGDGAESYRYEVREGFASSSATLTTDRDGNLLEYAAGGVKVVARSKAYIEQKFGLRREAALRRLPK